MSCCFCASSFATVDIRSLRFSGLAKKNLVCRRGSRQRRSLRSENSKKSEDSDLAYEGAGHDGDSKKHIADGHRGHWYRLPLEAPVLNS
ncbi:hypothetical protein ABIF65_007999 [Bradyrhizobium japonicum]